MKTRILFVITDLYPGGAESMLRNLLAQLDHECFECEVISLRDTGPIGEQIQAMGIPVHALNMNPQRPGLSALFRLAKRIRSCQPDIVQTWMYHADFMGSLAGLLAGRPPLIWGIHHTVGDLKSLKAATRWIVRLNAWLSHSLPAQIVCCAESTLHSHAAIGYHSKKMVLITNGFDLNRFHTDPDASSANRAEMKISSTTPLIGLCARFHPVKDHFTFLQAARMIAAQLPEVRFVLCGENITADNALLSEWIEMNELKDRCILLGQRNDMPSMLASLDLLVSASLSEAFPMILGEAMACGVPCVATDVGDSARIVGETGRIVPPGQPKALAAACLEILSLTAEARQALGQAARERVEAEYNLSTITNQYEQLYRDVTSHRKFNAVKSEPRP
jgi:glycosyltransferase involved in cell wall biosynthesis